MKNSDVYFHLGRIIAEGRRKHTETHTPAQRSAGWEAGYKEKARTLKVPVELREPAPKRSKRRQKAKNRAASRQAPAEDMDGGNQ